MNALYTQQINLHNADEEITGGNITLTGTWLSTENSLPVPLIKMAMDLCDFMVDLKEFYCPISKGEYHTIYRSTLPAALPKVITTHRNE